MSRVNAQQIEKLEAERDRLRIERDRLSHDLATVVGTMKGIEYALATAKGESTFSANPDVRERMPRGAIKDHVLRLVTENAVRGLIATELVDLAKAQGIALDRGSVSSLLSKLKQEGTLTYEDGKYRPSVPATPKQPPVRGSGLMPPGGAVVHAKAG